MKKLLLALLLTPLLFSACKEGGDNLANNHRMEDTLFKTYPTVNRVTAEVKDNEEVHIILGDKELYNAPEEQRLLVTDEIAHMVIDIYEKDNWLKKGTVTFTSDEVNINVKESLKRTYDMHLEELMTKLGR